MKFFGVNLLCAIFVLLFAPNIALADAENSDFHTIDLGYNKNIYGVKQIEAIKNWGLNTQTSGVISDSVLSNNGVSIDRLNNGEKISGIRAWNGLGELFTILQEKYFAVVFLCIVLFLPLAFLGHNKMIGARHYNHNSKIKVFSKYNILVHWFAAVPCMIICVTGLMMVFGAYLGGGALVRFARDLHGLCTPIFAVFGTLMFLMWIKDCLPKWHDAKWAMIMGGYWDKTDRLIPAHKFNAGQKVWFWVASFGGIVMVATGALMFFQPVDINTLRLTAMIHNVVGMAFWGMLITHIYMAVFAIEGALEAMISGNMSEEELSMLHSIYYDELKTNGKLEGMRVAVH
ncbi:formate dehydrogenase subunit gamma [Helicobacter sp. 23-1045]